MLLFFFCLFIPKIVCNFKSFNVCSVQRFGQSVCKLFRTTMLADSQFIPKRNNITVYRVARYWKQNLRDVRMKVFFFIFNIQIRTYLSDQFEQFVKYRIINYRDAGKPIALPVVCDLCSIFMNIRLRQESIIISALQAFYDFNI